MSDGFDFEEDDDHLLERIDNHEEFIRKQEHIEAIKDAVWKWRYWMIAAGVALLVLSIAALAFAVSRGSSGEPSPLFTSQERDQAFFSASEGTQQALRADAVYITRKPHLGSYFTFCLFLLTISNFILPFVFFFFFKKLEQLMN
ncbi:MAG: hypothetical protein Q8P67_21600 [archaeon]|nr:hypothetical protein [archaeon]